MNWKKFFGALSVIVFGFAAMVMFGFAANWILETLGIYWFIGGFFGVLALALAAIIATTDKDSPY